MAISRQKATSKKPAYEQTALVDENIPQSVENADIKKFLDQAQSHVNEALNNWTHPAKIEEELTLAIKLCMDSINLMSGYIAEKEVVPIYLERISFLSRTCKLFNAAISAVQSDNAKKTLVDGVKLLGDGNKTLSTAMKYL